MSISVFGLNIKTSVLIKWAEVTDPSNSGFFILMGLENRDKTAYPTAIWDYIKNFNYVIIIPLLDLSFQGSDLKIIKNSKFMPDGLGFGIE